MKSLIAFLKSVLPLIKNFGKKRGGNNAKIEEPAAPIGQQTSEEAVVQTDGSFESGKAADPVEKKTEKLPGGKRRKLFVALGILFFALVGVCGGALLFSGESESENGTEVPFSLSKQNHALFQGVRAGDVEAVRRAIQEGADFHVANSSGVTPIKAAIALNREDIVRTMLGEDAGASVNLSGGVSIEANDAALTYAIVQNRPQIVRMLLKHVADLDKVDKNGFTLLMYAIERNLVEIVREILAAGADVNQENKDGYTPLLKAVDMGRGDVVAELLKAGANAEARSPVGERAIDVARKRNKQVIIALLVNGVQ